MTRRQYPPPLAEGEETFPPQIKMRAREKAARAAGVNAHDVSDGKFLLRHGSPEMIERLRDGTLGMQEALRMLGRRTQRDRYRQKKQQVIDLCEAVLGGDFKMAEMLAAATLLAHLPRGPRKVPA